MAERCPCNSGLAFEDCCAPLLRGEQAAATALALMRSRYAAYVKGDMAYLARTLDAPRRTKFFRDATAAWNADVHWQGLRICSVEAGGVNDSEGTVSFEAAYSKAGRSNMLREKSRFRKKGDCWYYIGSSPESDSGAGPVRSAVPSRNAPCPCGSGKKYKRCCGA